MSRAEAQRRGLIETPLAANEAGVRSALKHLSIDDDLHHITTHMYVVLCI
jgi:hypothetical protein